MRVKLITAGAGMILKSWQVIGIQKQVYLSNMRLLYLSRQYYACPLTYEL